MDVYLLFGLLSAFLIGVSKGGMKGLSTLNVALMVIAYGAKNSVGIIVPLLVVGDILAVIYFKKHLNTKYLFRFLPAMLVGVFVAAYIGNDWDNAAFKKVMSVLILGSTAYMFWSEFRKKKLKIEDRRVSGIIGFGAGFTTMAGNLAGPFANLYFLATGMPKKELIGTAAWTFFLVNLVKVPLQFFTWKTINAASLAVNLYLIPFVLVGFWVGIKIVDKFSESGYRKFLLIVTALGAILILFRS